MAADLTFTRSTMTAVAVDMRRPSRYSGLCKLCVPVCGPKGAGSNPKFEPTAVVLRVKRTNSCLSLCHKVHLPKQADVQQAIL